METICITRTFICGVSRDIVTRKNERMRRRTKLISIAGKKPLRKGGACNLLKVDFNNCLEVQEVSDIRTYLPLV
jgi:hypothetical protein